MPSTQNDSHFVKWLSVFWCWGLAGVTCIVAIIISQIGKHPELICTDDYANEGRKACKPACATNSQTFALAGMKTCRKWLDCEDTKLLTGREHFFQGVVKKMYRARWNDYDVLISEAVSADMRLDFRHHVENLKLFSPSPYVVQAVGFCEESLVLTEYHPLGSALNVQLLPAHVQVRFGLCLSYVQILVFLHDHPSGTRVMCDSSSLPKTLSQYLLTGDLRLVLADLDALPRVEPSRGTVCGHRELGGDFVAPEQRWSRPQPFNETLATPYDEKTDVWKIPDVCDWFLGASAEADVFRFQLFSIHSSCKQADPKSRPTSKLVLENYSQVYSELLKHSKS